MSWKRAVGTAIKLNRVFGCKQFRVVGYRRPYGSLAYRWTVTEVTP